MKLYTLFRLLADVKIKSSLVLLFYFIAVTFSTKVYAATITTSGSGNWSSTTANAPWPGGTIPATGDDIVVGVGYTLTVDGNRTCNAIGFTGNSGTLSVNSGVQLTVTTLFSAPVAGASANGNANYTISGLGAISCSSFDCNNTKAPTGLFSTNIIKVISTVSDLSVSGNLTLNATAVTILFSLNKNNPVFNLRSGTVTVNGSLTTVNQASDNVSTFDMVTSAASPTLFLGGATPFNLSGTGTNTISLNGTGATVNYSRAGDQPVSAYNYTNLTCSSTGNRILANSGTIGIAGVFTPGTNTYTITSSTISYNAGGAQSITAFNYNNLALSTSGTKTFNAGTSGIANTLSITGTATADATTNSSTISYNGSANQTITTLTYYGLDVSSTGGTVTGINTSVTNFSINSGTLNQNTFTLTITGTATFTAGTINNGTVTSSGATSTFAGTVFGTIVNATSNGLYLNGSTFNNTATLTKNGASDILGTGGNTFNNTATITNSGSGYLVLGNTTADIFNGNVTFANTGSSELYMAFNSAGNQFNGNATFNNTGTGSTILSNFGPNATAAYNGNIVVNNTSTGIYFGGDGGQSTLAYTKTITIGGTGFATGALYLSSFTQSGATPQALTLTGTAILEVGPASTYNGSVDFAAPQLLLNGCTYNGTATLTKSGATDNASNGGNTFQSTTNITNNGTGYFVMGSISPDVFNGITTLNNTSANSLWVAYNSAGNEFNGDVTFNNSGSGFIVSHFTSVATVNYNENIIVNNTSAGSAGGIYFGGVAGIGGVAVLAAAKTITVGTGFTNGSLILQNFTQTGATAQTLTLSGIAFLQIGPVVTFDGNITFTAPQLYLNGCTYNGTASLTKNGASDNTSDGGNIFNASTTLTNSGTGFLRLGNTTSDDFNNDATFIQTNSGLVQPAYGTNCTIAGNLSTEGTATAISFGSTVILDGSGAQYIISTLSPTFNNLIISNTGNTVTSAVNSIVTSNLSVTSGTFDLVGFTADRATAGGTLLVSDNATLKIGGTNTYPNNYTTNTLEEAGTIEYSGTDQTVKGLTYGNLTLSGSGVKTMPGTALTINGDFSISGTATTTSIAAISVAGNLSIADGCNLSVSPVANLTVTGTITNNAGTSGFVLLSDATGTASLLHNTDNVPATVERYITGSAEAWHFLSAPVSNQGISGSWLPSGSYGNGTGYDLYVWNEPTNCWIYKLDTTSTVNWSTVHPGSNFTTGRGYLYSVQAANPTKSFVGNLNNGSITYPLTFSSTDAILKGFNLVGNPYPSSIDWEAPSGWTRNDLVNSGGGYDMWIWNQAANNYGVYNSFTGTGTNSVTRYIAPMQGYFVKASGAGNLGMNNDIRVHNGAGWFKNAETNNSILSVVVQSDADKSFDEALILFGYSSNNEPGTTKLFSHVLTSPSLYMPSGDEYYSVRYLTDTSDNPTVPVMLKPGKDGNYTINCNFEADKFQIVMLEDRQMHYIQNLKTVNTYNFIASKTDDANRFVLHFGPENNFSGNELPARIYTDGIQLIIDLTMVHHETTVMVYDVMGRKMLQQELHGEIQHNLSLNAPRQILIVYLKNQDGSLSRKVVWAGNQ